MNDKTSVETFLEDYYARLFHWVFSYQDRVSGWGTRSGGEERRSPIAGLKHRLKMLGAKRGWVARHFGIPAASGELAHIAMNQEKYARVYSFLGDEYSRQTYLDVLSFRVLGGRHVRMPVNTSEYWSHVDRDYRHVVKAKTYTTSWGWDLNLYNAPGRAGDIHLHMTAGSYLHYLILRCYDYNKEGMAIGVKPGDIVIDGGACWGEMAVIFADRCSPDGRVFTFEFSPDNMPVLRMNLAANPDLTHRIKHVERALGDDSGRRLAFLPDGPATQVGDDLAGKSMDVLSTTMDDFVEKECLDRVDFVKLDIEGSEEAALRGSVRTLQRFGPSLAISLYHKRDDLFRIPLYLHGLGLGYRFYVDHFTPHRGETVLFASKRG